MFLLTLLLITAQAFPQAAQKSLQAKDSQTPPGVVVLGYVLGPGVQVTSPLEKEVTLAPDSIPRTGSGDRDRDTTRYAASGVPRDLSMDASYGADPYSRESSTVSLPSGSQSAPKRIAFATLIIRNDGVRTIKSIDWDFPHPHIRNKRPAVRCVMHSKATIKPGETRTIREPIPPSTKGFNISKGNGPERTVTFISTESGIRFTVPIDSLRGGAQILRVTYNDRSTWQRP